MLAATAGCSHIRVFIAGATSTRATVRERRLGEHVVGEAVGKLRERVRGKRGDHQ